MSSNTILEPQKATSYKVSISNQKGGVAKTTTVLSLGASLAELGASVLVVDLDPQGHLTQALGVELRSLRHSVSDVLLNQATIIEISREGPVPNLDLVPADRSLILVEKLLNNSKGFEYRLSRSLEAVGGNYYDVVLFDCPPSFGPLTLNALVASDLVLIPVNCDYFSAQSLRIYIKLIETVRPHNPGLARRLLITMFDRRTRLGKLVLEQYRKNYGDLLFDTIIPVDSKLRESPIFGRPITQYAARTRGAQEYRSLARELMACQEKTN